MIVIDRMFRLYNRVLFYGLGTKKVGIQPIVARKLSKKPVRHTRGLYLGYREVLRPQTMSKIFQQKFRKPTRPDSPPKTQK